MNLLTAVDWLVIAAYFAVLYAVVLRHGAANRANPTEFFLAGRNAGWFIVGASIFATNISASSRTTARQRVRRVCSLAHGGVAVVLLADWALRMM